MCELLFLIQYKPPDLVSLLWYKVFHMKGRGDRWLLWLPAVSSLANVTVTFALSTLDPDLRQAGNEDGCWCDWQVLIIQLVPAHTFKHAMSQYTAEGWARDSVHSCVFCIVHISGYGYTSYIIYYIELIYNSGHCSYHHHQNYLHHRSQMLYGLGSRLLWFLISEPVQHLFMMCGVPPQTQHLTVYFILDPWSTEANCCHKIP